MLLFTPPPLEKGVGLHLNKFVSPTPKDALCQVWLKLAQWFWGRRFLSVGNLFLHLLLSYTLGEGHGPTTSHHIELLCAKFSWNWPNGSGVDDFKMLIIYFCYYLPLEKSVVLHLNRLESPSPKKILCFMFCWN